MIVATAKAQTEAVVVLASKNASFTLTCDNGYTAYNYALASKHKETIDIVVKLEQMYFEEST